MAILSSFGDFWTDFSNSSHESVTSQKPAKNVLEGLLMRLLILLVSILGPFWVWKRCFA